MRLLEKGIVDPKPLITHIYPAEKAQELFELASKHADGYIKGVVTF